MPSPSAMSFSRPSLFSDCSSSSSHASASDSIFRDRASVRRTRSEPATPTEASDEASLGSGCTHDTRVYAERRFAEFLGPWSATEIALVNTVICDCEAEGDTQLSEATRNEPPFAQSHRWICVLVFDPSTEQTFYYASRWTDRKSGLVADSAQELADRIRASVS